MVWWVFFSPLTASLSSVTEHWKCQPHFTKSKMSEIILCYEKSLYLPRRSNYGAPHIFLRKRSISPPVSVFSAQRFPMLAQCGACVCVGGVLARGLLIGLIKQSCCTAPVRFILFLPSVFFFFRLPCFDVLKPIWSSPPASPTSCPPLLPSPPVLLLSAVPWAVAALSLWPCSSSSR